MKHLLLSLALLISFCKVFAVPANPTPYKVLQPDGSCITLKLNGDEFGSFNTTADGYTVVKNDKGFYSYAVIDGDNLVASQFPAHDADSRSAKEISFLNSINKYTLAPKNVTASRALRAKAQSDYQAAPLKSSISTHPFKGILLLVEFNDKKFSRSDIQTIFKDMVDKNDYTGFKSEDLTKEFQYTGSVRDYFRDNSDGKFDAHFDVVGPIEVPYSCTYPQKDNVGPLIKSACQTAAKSIDFAQYDNDNNYLVDIVYVVFAGYGSHIGGNSASYVWPHAGGLSPATRIGNVFVSRYACSTELGGRDGDTTIDGIGTICHEFSHVLGLMDEYDTNDATDGRSFDPGEWSLMSGGGYLNNGRTPSGYSIFQRYTLGWANPVTITDNGTYTLSDIATSNTGYRIDTPVKNEYFLLDNHQYSKWDKYLPGKGMLVFRVDSTSTSPWSSNAVNADSKHNYYQMVRANPMYSFIQKTYVSSANDPFPGGKNITSITNSTKVALKSWTGVDNNIVISDITDNDGVISFFATNLNSGIDDVASDNASFKLIDNTIVCPAADSPVSVYSVGGQLMLQKMPDNGSVYLGKLPRGLYIIRQGAAVLKVAL